MVSRNVSKKSRAGAPTSRAVSAIKDSRICPHCHNPFKFNSHISRCKYNPDRTIYKCNVCASSFTTRHGFDKHMRSKGHDLAAKRALAKEAHTFAPFPKPNVKRDVIVIDPPWTYVRQLTSYSALTVDQLKVLASHWELLVCNFISNVYFDLNSAFYVFYVLRFLRLLRF